MSSGCVKCPALEPANQLQDSLIQHWREKLTAEAEKAGGRGMRETQRGRKKTSIDWVAGRS